MRIKPLERNPPKLIHEQGEFWYVWPDGFSEKVNPLLATALHKDDQDAISGFVVWHAFNHTDSYKDKNKGMAFSNWRKVIVL